MNIMTPEALKGRPIEGESAENPALNRLMKAWESKNAKRAAKGTGLTLMAVSLAACGGSGGGADDDVDQTFRLTLEDDDFQGGDGNDVFNAPLSTTIGGLISGQTLQQADVLDGGEGVDTLNALLNGTGAGAGLFGLASPSITNIEIFNLTASGAPGGLDLINSSGYTQLWNINSNANLTLANVREGADIGLQGTNGNTTYQVNFTSAAAADIVDQTVVANAVGGSTATGQRTILDIRDAAANSGINTLTLSVSNGVRMELRNSAENIENLIITGSGPLVLTAQNDFPNLVEFNSTGYAPALTLDVSGGGSIKSFLTGAGNDTITMAAATFSADTAATTLNLGAGDNRLILVDSVETNPPGTFTGGGLIDSDELSALDFTLGPVSNVQTLELRAISLDGDATLALEGVGGLETLALRDFNNGGGWDLSISGAPEALLITENPRIEMNGGLFTIEGVVDLTVETTFDGDSDIRFDGGFNSDTLETLLINASDDAVFFSDGGLDALRTLEVNAAGSDVGFAAVALSNLAGEEFGALESVAISAAEDATLDMDGQAAILQEQIFRIGTTGNPAAQDHFYSFAYEDENGLPQVLVVNEFGVPQAGGSQQIANAIAAAFEALPEFTAIAQQFSGNTWEAVVTRVEPGSFSEIDAEQTAGGRALTEIFTQGELGSGFEALEDIVVDAGETARVFLEDAYGNFTVDVTAGEDGFVTLTNTGATSASLSFGTEVDYIRDGDDNIVNFDFDLTNVGYIDTFGDNSSLKSITISGAVADPRLGGDLSALETIDLTGVTEQFIVDAADFFLATGPADFGKVLGGNDFVTYLIGGTSSEWEATPGNLNGASIIYSSIGDRETFKFTDTEFGTVIITDFNVGGGGDRIDLSELGFTNKGQLAFDAIDTTGDDTADSLQITDDSGGPIFGGSIILIGITDENDLSSANFVFG